MVFPEWLVSKVLGMINPQQLVRFEATFKKAHNQPASFSSSAGPRDGTREERKKKKKKEEEAREEREHHPEREQRENTTQQNTTHNLFPISSRCLQYGSLFIYRASIIRHDSSNLVGYSSSSMNSSFMAPQSGLSLCVCAEAPQDSESACKHLCVCTLCCLNIISDWLTESWNTHNMSSGFISSASYLSPFIKVRDLNLMSTSSHSRGT